MSKKDFWEGYVPEPDSTCSNALRAQGKAYPRTCKKCGLGPCVGLAQQALDKKAENARELGLDYEPDGMHHNKPARTLEELYALSREVLAEKPAQRKPLTVEQLTDLFHADGADPFEFARAIEAAHGIKENT